MSMLDLDLADGWCEVAPPKNGLQLMGELDGSLFLLAGDLTPKVDFGRVGPVDCPLAFDGETKTVFRYVCEGRIGFEDFSQIRAFNLNSGKSFTMIDLPLSHWVLWLLEWIGGSEKNSGRLLGLLASDRSMADQLELRHQLFALKPGMPQTLNRPICHDAYHPIAFSRKRRELLFAGAEGIHIVGLRGERRASLRRELDTATGRGGCFEPSGSPTVVIGGEGLYLWNFESGKKRQLRRRGQYPVWCKRSNLIYFSESSSDLFEYRYTTGESCQILGLRKNHAKEISFASPVKVSQNGRFLALTLTGKKLLGIKSSNIDVGTRERVYSTQHELCVLDVERKEIYRRKGFFRNLCWIEKSSDD